MRNVYLSDEAVGGGVRGGAAIRALEAALPLGVLPLRESERQDREGKVNHVPPPFKFIPTCPRREKGQFAGAAGERAGDAAAR